MKPHTRSSHFLYAGYTYQQEIDWKWRREELRKELARKEE